MPDHDAIPNDGTIVDEVLAGRTEQFGKLVKRYERPLFRLALSRLGKRPMAQDAVQETFLSAFKSLHTYNSRYSFRTWLWTILINQCRAQHRKSLRRAREVSAESLDNRLDERHQSAEQIVIFAEESMKLEQTLKQLPEKHADAIRLRFFGDLSYPEIARVMDICVTSAKNYVRRGLLTMSEQLVGFESPTTGSDSGSDSTMTAD